MLFAPDSVRNIGVNLVGAGALGLVLGRGQTVLSLTVIVGGLWLIREGTRADLPLHVLHERARELRLVQQQRASAPAPVTA